MTGVFFQGIGVLVGYNFALPYYIASYSGLKITLLNDLLSYIMGGFYYKSKSHGLLLPHRDFHHKAGLYGFYKYFDLSIRYAIRSDVIHINDTGSLITGKLLKLGKRKVLTIHGIPNEKYPGTSILNSVDEVVAPYDYEALMLRRIYGVEPKIIHHGVDPSLYSTCRRKGDRGKNRRILWVARLDTAKKPWRMIYASLSILRNHRDVSIEMYTRAIDKNLYSMLRPVIEDLRRKYPKRFIFKSKWIPYIRMPHLYNKADIYVSTGIAGIDLIEATACGNIIVAEDNPISREILGDTGLYYNSQSELVEMLESAISMLDNPSAVAKHRAKQSRRLIEYEGYWNIAAKKYKELYISLLDSI